MAENPAKTQALALRPEVELILCCARVCVSNEGTSLIRALLQKDLDWDYLLQRAVRHGVLPLLYRSLNTICPEAVPKAALDQLRDYFHANEFHNRLLTEELVELLKLFQTHGVAAIPYKGPSLAVSAYANLALREFSDLDILLVHKQDFPKAKGLLISRGYQPCRSLTEAQEASHLRARQELCFVNDNQIAVDLHWAIRPKEHSFPLAPERLWERRESISLAGSVVPSLSPEDLLLILCVHGTKHKWKRLEWLCDVAALIRAKQAMDWEYSIEQSRRLGSRRTLLFSLNLVSDLFGSDLPDEVLQGIQADPAIQSLTAQAREWVLGDGPPPVKQWPTFYLQTRERLRDRVTFIHLRLRHHIGKAMTPNERDHALLRLPPALSFLYYPLRVIRLVRDHGSNPLKRFLRLF